MDYFMNSSAANSTYSQCPYSSYIFMSTSAMILTILGLPITIQHLWIAVSTSPVDILNLNISIFNVAQCFFHLSDIFMITLLKEYMRLVSLPWLFFSVTAGSLFLCIICFERYTAVVWPTHYPLLKTYWFREVCSVVPWTMALLVSMGTVFMMVYTLSQVQLVGRCVIICINVLFCLNIYTSIKCNKRILAILKKSGPGSNDMHPIKVKAFQTVRYVSTILYGCYFPTTLILGVIEPTTQFPTIAECIVIPICLCLILMASILYSFLTLHSKGRLCSCLNKSLSTTSL